MHWAQTCNPAGLPRCSDYMTWQSVTVVYTHRKMGVPGPIIRQAMSILLALCCKAAKMLRQHPAFRQHRLLSLQRCRRILPAPIGPVLSPSARDSVSRLRGGPEGLPLSGQNRTRKAQLAPLHALLPPAQHRRILTCDEQALKDYADVDVVPTHVSPRWVLPPPLLPPLLLPA